MSNKLFSLEGKRALVTGGSRGLGFAIAKGLAENGSDVVISSRHADELTEAKKIIEHLCPGRKVWPFEADMEKPEDMDEFLRRVVSEAGGVEILVNNAGVNAQNEAEDFELNVWHKIVQINLTSVFTLSQAFCKHRKEKGGGKIVNVGSLWCHATRPRNPAYAASKGGLLLLTKQMAVEWAKYSINVNAIGPGFFKTNMTKHVYNNSDFSKWVEASTPFGRWGEPEELVGAVVFMSSEAGKFVTGQIIYIDGGWTASL